MTVIHQMMNALMVRLMERYCSVECIKLFNIWSYFLLFFVLLQSALGLSRNDTHGSSEIHVGAKRSVDLTFEQQRASYMSKRVADGLGEQLGAENLEPANSVVEDAVSCSLLFFICSYSFSYTNHASHYSIRLEHMSDGGTCA
jgi:hypothetical protein